jgi:hypothetical protein
VPPVISFVFLSSFTVHTDPFPVFALVPVYHSDYVTCWVISLVCNNRLRLLIYCACVRVLFVVALWQSSSSHFLAGGAFRSPDIWPAYVRDESSHSVSSASSSCLTQLEAKRSLRVASWRLPGAGSIGAFASRVGIGHRGVHALVSHVVMSY